MADVRVFTVEEVNALLPRLNVILGEQRARQEAIESALADLADLAGGPIRGLAPVDADPPEVARRRVALAAQVKEYEGAWSELAALGAVLKDPRLGLVDFYGRVDGQLVWLCWKYGETEVGHYHALDTGFSARRVLDRGTRPRTLN